MAEIVCLHAKKDVEEFCRRNPFVHLYAIGDLDDFFWPHTTWLALQESGRVQQLALLYTDLTMRMPTLLAFAEEPENSMHALLLAVLPVLPRRFYAHLSQSLADIFTIDYHMRPQGGFHKMALTDPCRLANFDGSEAVPLSAEDTKDLVMLYGTSYPGNWFVSRMLDTGFYFGIRRGTALVSVAGVHAYSREYKVAALGNITTLAEARGQGLATTVTARLCQELLRAGIECVGLNVKADNRGAIACYEKHGFERAADNGEYTVEAR